MLEALTDVKKCIIYIWNKLSAPFLQINVYSKVEFLKYFKINIKYFCLKICMEKDWIELQGWREDVDLRSLQYMSVYLPIVS